MKCYIGGSSEPGDCDFVTACFAKNSREARKLMWKYGDLSEECEGHWVLARAIRAKQHDPLFAKYGLKTEQVIWEDSIYRDMGWVMEGDQRCASCGLATYEGKWPLCDYCGQCVECGHDDGCGDNPSIQPEKPKDSL